MTGGEVVNLAVTGVVALVALGPVPLYLRELRRARREERNAQMKERNAQVDAVHAWWKTTRVIRRISGGDVAGDEALTPARRAAVDEALDRTQDYALALDAVRGWVYDPWPGRSEHADLTDCMHPVNLVQFAAWYRDGERHGKAGG